MTDATVTAWPMSRWPTSPPISLSRGYGTVRLRRDAEAAAAAPRRMVLTRSFKELVQRRVTKDPAFGAALLREGIDAMRTGDIGTGKAILRDYIKATVGSRSLARRLARHPRASCACWGRVRRFESC